MEVKQHIATLSSQYFREICEIRRTIHQNPELSFEEFNTNKYICSKLNEYGISYKTGIATTGILAFIKGNLEGEKTVALRAELDALPIQEETQLEYKSKNPGVMHACGHDVHIANLLGTAKILNQLRDHFGGTFVLIFQPAEELFPGGAKLMLEEGVLNDLNIDAMLALHVLPELTSGTVGFKSGMYMASGDEIFFTVKGKGGHGALPNKITDTVLITAHIITALQQIVSRNAPPEIPSVLSFGRVIADGATNIIPNEVKVEGTFRTMDETWRTEALMLIKRMGESIAEGMGAECQFNIAYGYPVLVNDEKITRYASMIAKDYLGAKNVIGMGIRMTSEDFAYFTEKYPSCFFRLGVKSPDNSITSSLHNPNFEVDENALKTGMEVLSYIAFNLINKK